MTTVTVRGGFDTFAGSANPTTPRGSAKFLQVSTGAQYAYVYLRNPAPRGATVTSAVLHLNARGASSGARVVTARRVGDSWKASKLDWNNKPGVVGITRTVSIGTVADGETVQIDVTPHLQTVVNGSPHYGWRIETDGAQHKFYGFDAGDNKPVLVVTYSDEPGTPTNLAPSGGAVSVAKPVLQFDYSDVNDDELVAVQVQVDPAANGSSPAFDSGEVSTSEPELDLATTAYAGLAEAASTQWRVRVKDSGGLWSDWSDWATFNRVTQGTLTINSPSVAAPYVTEPTPPILATLAGRTLAAYRLAITPADDRTTILWDSGKITQAGGTIGHTVPARGDNGRPLLLDDRTYSLRVRTFDTVDRVETTGDPIYVQQWLDFTMDDDLATSTPTNLTATQEGGTPFVRLRWETPTAPDSFVVRRGGTRIEVVDPADVLVSTGVYEWLDATAAPHVEHTYRVRAVAGGKQSELSAAAVVTPSPVGVWILDPERGLSFALSDLDVDNWRFTDQGVTYQPLGSPYSVRIVQGLNGMSGSFTGMMRTTADRDVAAFKDDLWAIKERPARTVQLVAVDFSIPVKLDGLSLGPHPRSIGTLPGKLRYLVSFGFRQVGDLPFEARV